MSTERRMLTGQFQTPEQSSADTLVLYASVEPRQSIPNLVVKLWRSWQTCWKSSRKNQLSARVILFFLPFTVQRSLPTSCPCTTLLCLLVAIAKLLQPCTTSLCEAAIFLPSTTKLCRVAIKDCYQPKVGTAALRCLQRWVFTQRSKATYFLLRWGLRSKIAASHNELLRHFFSEAYLH